MLKLLAVTLVAILLTGVLALRAAPGRTRKFLAVAAISALAFPVLAVLHNAVDALFHFEEPVFFLLAVIGAPAGVVIGLAGAAVSAFLHRQDPPRSRA